MNFKVKCFGLLFCLVILLAACQSLPGSTLTLTPTMVATFPPASTETPTTHEVTLIPTATTTPEPLTVRFAVIGDYGMDNQGEADVAALVHSWKPDLVIAVGDNNYPYGGADTMDAHVGRYYHDFIFPYLGGYGPGAQENRFFPTLGNHDWITDKAQPYFDYFTLPGNERYYEFIWGPVHFFALDSDDHEPDGVNRSSIQAAWLQAGLAASVSPWNIVYFHYPPYSSGYHGSTTWLQWPFAAWGADAIFTGHDHTYERLVVDGIPYFVNGLGGAGIYEFNEPLPETQFRYNADHGAMLVSATETEMDFVFYDRSGNLIDSYRVTKP